MTSPTTDDAASEARHDLSEVLQQTEEAFVVTDLEGRFRYVNPAFTRLFGYASDEIIGQPLALLAPADETPVHGLAQAFRGEVVRVAKDGRRIPVLLNIGPLRIGGDAPTGYIGAYTDIRERKAAEAGLHDAKERLALALDASQLSMFDFDIARGRVVLDEHWARMMRLPPGPTITTVGALAQRVDAADAERIGTAMIAAFKGTNPGFTQEFRFRDAHDAVRWIRCSGKVVERDASGRALRGIGTNLDITAGKQAEEQLRQVAVSDWLTGLPNRFALGQHLPRALARARRRKLRLAVGLIDLDDFKPVNDRWGHAAGDRLLRELARRLQGLLREADFVARLGGDEFVVVIEDLDGAQVTDPLDAALARLHFAVETPFEVAPGTLHEIGMTMGLALFPDDAADADALIRQADAAMYQSKQHKADRAQWWRIGTSQAEPPVRDESFEPYGTAAADLLERAREPVAAAIRGFSDAFLADATSRPEALALPPGLDSDEILELVRQQREHLEAILEPRADAARLVECAVEFGRLLALSGMAHAWKPQAHARFRKVLGERLNRTLMPARERHAITAVVEARLLDDIQNALQAGQATMESYLRVLGLPLPAAGTPWVDALRTELDALGALPGVLDAASSRPDSLGIFEAEAASGPASEAVRALTSARHRRPNLDSNTPRGRSLVSRAWRDEAVVTSAICATDPQACAWREELGALGVRGALAFPVLADSGRPIAVVRLFGRYPRQFDSTWMHQFAIGLQQRWTMVWLRCRAPAATVVPRAEALAWRERLFAGGLQVVAQPIVDLRSGAVVKAEALARLVMPDGRVVSPGAFLPQLSSTELDRLFRTGLDLALSQLQEWDAEGMGIELSVNISPNTLLDPDCPAWVEDALLRHRVAPHRLTLELLESHGIDTPAQDHAIARLVRLGVKLAMDDLGTGYSSLQRLAALPFDTIKVDQSLLLRIRDNPVQTLSLVRTIIQMGQDFEREVVIEGLEDEGMVEAVTLLGAELGQGYALGRPMPAEQLPGWTRDRPAPTSDAPLRHDLGALAYHWQFMHDGRHRHPSPLRECPLTRFLAERGLDASEAAAWHALVHARLDASDASHRLTAWLTERVKAGGVA